MHDLNVIHQEVTQHLPKTPPPLVSQQPQHLSHMMLGGAQLFQQSPFSFPAQNFMSQQQVFFLLKAIKFWHK